MEFMDQKKLDELAVEKATNVLADQTPEQQENTKSPLEMADMIFQNFLEPLSMALNRLSKKETARVVLAAVQFPFIEVSNKTLKSEKEKSAFMFMERLLYANMVKRAHIELAKALEQTSNEVALEEKETTIVTEKEEVKNEEAV